MFPAALINLVIALVVVGILLWALSQFSIDPFISKMIRVILVVVISLYVLFVIAGMFGYSGAPFAPRLTR